MSDWFLVYSKPRQEDVAANGLQDQGYLTYLPKMLSRRRRSEGMVEVEEPLFPRYLFMMPGHAEQSIVPAQYTSGVQKLVRFGTDFLVVRSLVIDALRKREDPDTGFHVPDSPHLERGERIRIASGALAGLEGVFEARTSKHRVIVLLELLGQHARTEVRVDELDQSY